MYCMLIYCIELWFDIQCDVVGADLIAFYFVVFPSLFVSLKIS